MSKKALRVDPGADCKRRVAEIKDLLPKEVRTIITERHREYNTASGIRLISNVIAGYSSDLKLTEILEKIAKEKEANNG